MSSKDVCDGIINAKLMDEGLNILIFEIFLVSGVLGYWKHSWGVFWGSFGLFSTTLFFKPLAKILIIILSIAWGIGGYLMGRYSFGNSIVSEVVLSCLGVLSSLAVHRSALQRTLESPSKNKSKPISQNKPQTVGYQEKPNYKSKPEAMEDEHCFWLPSSLLKRARLLFLFYNDACALVIRKQLA